LYILYLSFGDLMNDFTKDELITMQAELPYVDGEPCALREKIQSMIDNYPHSKCPSCAGRYRGMLSTKIKISVCPRCNQEVWEDNDE
jgi:hypothetical protein